MLKLDHTYMDLECSRKFIQHYQKISESDIYCLLYILSHIKIDTLNQFLLDKCVFNMFMYSQTPLLDRLSLTVGCVWRPWAGDSHGMGASANTGGGGSIPSSEVMGPICHSPLYTQHTT